MKCVIQEAVVYLGNLEEVLWQRRERVLSPLTVSYAAYANLKLLHQLPPT